MTENKNNYKKERKKKVKHIKILSSYKIEKIKQHIDILEYIK